MQTVQTVVPVAQNEIESGRPVPFRIRSIDSRKPLYTILSIRAICNTYLNRKISVKMVVHKKTPWRNKVPEE